MNKTYLIKKLAELNVKTELAIHKKLSKIITNSYNDNNNHSLNEDKVYFDVDLFSIKELMNETDTENIKIKTISLD